MKYAETNASYHFDRLNNSLKSKLQVRKWFGVIYSVPVALRLKNWRVDLNVLIEVEVNETR